MGAERFFFYENWTNTFCKAHRGSCSFCNEGQGVHGRGTHTSSGQWHGPFGSMEEALAEARTAAAQYSNRSVWEVSACGFCG